jgi:hypothetical protein
VTLCQAELSIWKLALSFSPWRADRHECERLAALDLVLIGYLATMYNWCGLWQLSELAI